MLQDISNIASDKQSCVLAALGGVGQDEPVTFLSTYSIDMGAPGTIPGAGGGSARRDISKGNSPHFLLQVNTAFTDAAGNGELVVDVVMADDAALTSNLTVLQTSATLYKEDLVSGYRLKLGLPEVIAKRYLGLQYTNSAEVFTAGTITGTLVLNVQET